MNFGENMNKIFFVLVFVLQLQVAQAQRLTMQQIDADDQADSAEPTRPQMENIRQDNTTHSESLKATLTRLCESASREDLDSYCSFFDNPSPKSRKSTALTFAEHDVSMNLLDCHVVTSTESEAEVVVKYTMTFSRNTTIYLSVVNLKKFGDNWKIVSEKITKQFAANEMAGTGRIFVNNPVQHFPDIDDEDSESRPKAVDPNCPTGNCGKNKIPMGIAQPALDFDLGAGGCNTGRCQPRNDCAFGRCPTPQRQNNSPAVFPELEDF